MSKVYVVFCMDTEGPCDDPDNDSLLKTWKDVDPQWINYLIGNSGSSIRIAWEMT